MSVRPLRRISICLAGLGLLALVSGCARTQPTNEEVAGPYAPPTLGPGPVPPGGISTHPTGMGAGGSAAGGYGFHRAGGIVTQPTKEPAPFDPNVSRMSPADSDGSGPGDRGNPVPPNVPVTPQPAGR